ncbi:MAG TPA: hypothetical protein PKL13_01410 [bacterium]|nr:hypothetical protein [bacterium]
MVINTNFEDNIQRTKANSISSTYKKIAGIFIFSTIFLVAIILYFSLSKAEIILKVKSQTAKISASTQVKEGTTNNNYLETSVLNGRMIELVLEKTKQFDVQEKKTSADKYGGMMKIVNNRATPQTLVAKTRFQSQNGKIFRIQEKIVVPGNSSINAYVIAEEIGDDYAETQGKFIIPGLNTDSQKYIYGELDTAMTKESITINQITQEDFDKAQQILTDELKLEAISKMKDVLNQGEEINENDIYTEIITKSSNKQIDEKVPNFEYTLKLKIVGVVFNKEELLKLAQSLLDRQLSQGQKLLNYDENSFRYNVGSYVADEKSATIESELSANIVSDSNSEAFNTEKFKGLTQEEIIDYFRVIPGVENVKVKFTPFWVKKAPKMADHIKVIIE